MHLRRNSQVAGATPLLFALACLLSLLSPLAGVGSPGARAGSGEPAFSVDTDPAFVLRLAFRVAKPQGTSWLDLRGPQAKAGYRLLIGPASLSLVEGEGPGSRKLCEAPLRWGRSSALVVLRRKSLLRVALDGRIILESAAAARPITRAVLRDPERRLALAGEPRYQPCEEIRLSDDFMAGQDGASRWEPLTGTWHIAGVSRPTSASDPFKLVGFAGSDGASLCSETYWFWSDYRASVSARMVGRDSGVGILFGYQGRDRHFGFSWGGPGGEGGANRVRLWRREGASVRVLAERPAYARVGQWYRLSVETQGGRITARVDENPVLTAQEPRLLGGQCGLFVSGRAGAEFDDWAVCDSDSADDPVPAGGVEDAPAAEREFADDPFMASWGNVRADWEPALQAGHQWCWHQAVLFGDASVRVAAPASGAGAPSLAEAILMGEPGKPGSGYRILSEAGKVTLYRIGRPVASAPSAAAPTAVEVSGGRLRVLAGDRVVLRYADRVPIARGRVGVRLSKPMSLNGAAKSLRVASSRLSEYRFDAAPVDWGIEAGEWVATTRWACVPHWNFFGGRGKPMATLWNKRRFGGDQWIEAFIAPREGTSDRMHFAFPINLNLSFCAAGEATGSGYSMVYRSHDEPALLYRKGKVVAVNREIVLPNWRSDQMLVYYRITQTWHHFEILREGGRIRVWVEVPSQGDARLERRLLFDYTDPEPLPGDRLGLWTWGDNGMAIARVRVSAARRLSPAADLFAPPASPGAAGVSSNPINGGSFRTDLTRVPVDAGRKPMISFEFQADPGAVLALYAVAGGQRFRARLLGGVAQDGDTVPMGAARLTAKSGAWKLAEFSLRQALRSFFPTGKLPLVEQLFVANLSARPDQVGGLSANPKGTRFRWRAAVSPGRPVPAPFRLVGPKGPDAPSGAVRIAVADETLDPADCLVTVGGEGLRCGSPGVGWDGQRRELVANLGDAGLSYRDGAPVRLTVSAPGVRRGRHLTLEWRMRFAADKTPPAPPVVATSLGPDRADTFEAGLGAWRRLGGEQGASLWRDDSTRASGRYSLRLFHRRVAGPFAALLCERAFDTRRWPALTFSYRVPAGVELNLICEVSERWYEIAFTDRENTYPVVGAIGGAKADGKWHRAEVDLAGAARASGAGSTVISKLFFADSGWMNNLQDVAWHVDDVRFVPALPVGQPKTITWSAGDLSGITAFSWVFDAKPDTVPDTTPEAPTEGVPVPAGAGAFHVRARDGAGNWGSAAHFRFAALDPGAPAAVEAEPAVPTGGRIAAPAAQVALRNADSLDIESVRWSTVTGGTAKSYGLAGRNLRWDRGKGTLSWEDSSLADGAVLPITCTLKASDLAGRQVLSREWKWVVDPSLDRTPPAAPFVSYAPANRLSRADFEAGVPGDVELRRSAWMFHDTECAPLGKGCVRFSNLESGDFFAAFLRKSPYAVHDYPRVAFDYRFEGPGCNLNVVSVVNGDLQTVGFAGANGAYPVFVQGNIGRIAGVRQDGRWHHAEFDFGALLRKRYPKAPRFFADYLGTWATGQYAAYDNPQGISLWLDNITLFSPRATSAGFEWQPPDDTNGIQGYSYSADHAPETLPDERIDTRATRCRLDPLTSGAWVFHIRACDGAGNWGPAAHVPFELTK